MSPTGALKSNLKNLNKKDKLEIIQKQKREPANVEEPLAEEENDV